SSDLEDLCFHINTKISNIKKFLMLRDSGEDQCRKSMLNKIGIEVILVHDLLSKMEAEVRQQEKLKNLLKKMQKAAERDQNEAQYLLEHIPPYLPKPTQSCIPVPTAKHGEQTEAVKPNHAKKPAKEKKKPIKEAALITTEEFESVPAYLKGRITYDQINAVVQELNKAVVGKYQIMHQPLKSMNAPAKNLYYRFIEEETKDTKGLGFFFSVNTELVTF
ncbi:SKA1 protein, partial [Pardalotus punctatus]|nr:SKA1 protein [Pardalotus punctatus]